MTMTEVDRMIIDTHTINSDIEEKNSISEKEEEPINEEDKITLEDLAPDGGWGWMIALAMILITFIIVGQASTFAIIFDDFLQDSGYAGTVTSIGNSIYAITYSIASVFTNILLKRYSLRLVGIAGVLFHVLPNIALAFISNVFQIPIISFFEGFGLGLIFTVTNTVFNSYFVKKRAKVMYASQVIIAFGGIIYPILSEKMLPIYGFRGTAAITQVNKTCVIGAISFHSVVGMMMIHPVEWHAKKLEDVRAEKAREKEQKFSQELALSNRRSTIDVVHLSFKTKCSSLCSLKEERGLEMLIKTSAQRAMSFSSIESHGGAKSKFIWKSLSKRTSTISASSLVDLATHTTCTSSDIRQLHPEKKTNEKQTDKENREKKEKQNKEIEEKEGKQNKGTQEKKEKQNEEVQEEEDKQDKEIQEKEEKQNTDKEQKMTGYKTILKDLVDMSLVKNFCFLNLCFGVNFVYYSDIGFIYLLPIIITDAGHSKDYAALSVTIIGIAELTAKILLSVFTLIINIKSKYIFFAATILMEFAKIGFLLCKHTLKGALITSALIGVVRSWLLVSQPLVIIEDLNIEKFASAYGINSVINCLVTIIFGAIVGIIRDWTDSYEIYQISLLVMNSVFILPWMLQFIFVDFRKWRKQRARKANIIDHWE
ncbi:uncharacterized protein [Mycetomoellerius zeteki]|uniref:uncharacterized protein n=1 Tax=Mycetomoellerius zeteki TaxID=64791 RepID=UPI00084E9A66|nr:PREDICTED: uncharacterized protein LOC108721880 [Trachymyrmex zeteki]